MAKSSPATGPPVVLKPATYARHAAAVAYVESQVRTRAPREGNDRGPGACWLRKAKTGSGGIGAASSTDNPGEGPITLCDWSDATGKWVTTSETATGLNPSTAGPVAANQFVTVAWVSGKWEVIMDPC